MTADIAMAVTDVGRNRGTETNPPMHVGGFFISIRRRICDGSIDRKLEAGICEKGDACALVLDGHLLGENPHEVNLSEPLDIAQREFRT